MTTTPVSNKSDTRGWHVGLSQSRHAQEIPSLDTINSTPVELRYLVRGILGSGQRRLKRFRGGGRAQPEGK